MEIFLNDLNDTDLDPREVLNDMAKQKSNVTVTNYSTGALDDFHQSSQNLSLNSNGYVVPCNQNK